MAFKRPKRKQIRNPKEAWADKLEDAEGDSKRKLAKVKAVNGQTKAPVANDPTTASPLLTPGANIHTDLTKNMAASEAR